MFKRHISFDSLWLVTKTYTCIDNTFKNDFNISFSVFTKEKLRDYHFVKIKIVAFWQRVFLMTYKMSFFD